MIDTSWTLFRLCGAKSMGWLSSRTFANSTPPHPRKHGVGPMTWDKVVIAYNFFKNLCILYVIISIYVVQMVPLFGLIYINKLRKVVETRPLPTHTFTTHLLWVYQLMTWHLGNTKWMYRFIGCVVWILNHVKQDWCKGSFYIAQYPVRWTAQSALHFLPPLADLFIPTPTRLLREAF